MVPFGANLDHEMPLEEIKNNLSFKPMTPIRLLFMGVNWERKGGGQALAVARELMKRGLKTELHIVGCEIPAYERESATNTSWIKHHGFISKSSAPERQKLNDLFLKSHFFILPTQADCAPVVFAEASSFGLPILTTDVGGITTQVVNGKNGFTFPSERAPNSYADVIERLPRLGCLYYY